MKKRAFKKLYNELFYISKHEKLSDKVFRCRMVLSILTILACTTVMAASTFALFYVDISTDSSTIAGAYYSVTVDNTENSTYICPLAYEDKQTFEIKADGTATTGYCMIRVGEQVYYTEKIPQGSSLTLTVQAAKDTPISFIPQWGTSSDYVNAGTCGNEIIHSTTPYTTYTVEPTAILANIAAHYGVSEEDILVYNNLSAVSIVDVEGENAASVLTVGMELKIPGVSPDISSYVAPVPAPPASTDENTGDGTQGENNDPPVADDTVSGSDTGTNEQTLEEPPATETPSTEDTTSGSDTGTSEEPAEDTPVQEPVNEE